MSWLILYSIVAGIVISLPMGPVGVLIVAHGLRSGFRAGVGAVCALIAGEAGYILLFSYGLSGWLFEVPWVRYPFFLAGGLLMVGLGGKAVFGNRSPSRPVATSGEGPQPVGRVFGEVFLVTVANPAILIIFAGVVASAERTLGVPVTQGHHLLVLVFVEVGTLLYFVPLVALAMRWREAVLTRGRRWLDLGSGLVLVALGLWVTAGELGRLLA